jgi:diguanylate cyclase (GGDEF)-like protein/PAS domain S-box-containing protein
MPSLRTNRPGWRAAWRLPLGLHRASAGCLVVGLLFVSGGYLEARRQVVANEAHRLAERAHSMQIISQQTMSRIEMMAASLQSVAAATGGDPVMFERTAQPWVDSGLLAFAGLFTPTGDRVAFVGASALPTPPAAEQREALGAAAVTGGLQWIGRFPTALLPRLGFAYGPGAGPAQTVAYVELSFAALPKLLDGLARFGDSGIDDLESAVYASPSQRPEDVVFSLARRLPIKGRAMVIPVRVGASQWTLVSAPRHPLVSGLERATPWILLAVGCLVTGLLVAVVEISHRRRRALASREKRFRLLVQHSSEVTTVLDPKLNVRYQTDTAERVLGYGPGQLSGRSISELLHPDDAGPLREAIDRAVAEPAATVSMTLRVRGADGGWRRVEANARNLLHEPVVGGVVLNWRDVTERARTEQARALLASIVEATPDMVVTCDPATNVLFLNGAGRELVGVGATEDLSGRALESFFAGWVAAGVLSEALATAKRDGAWSGELSVAGRHGEIPVLAVIVAHRGADGTVQYLSTIARDIRERKQMEHQLAHQAFHDPLTDLPNRVVFGDRLEQRLQRARRSFDAMAVLLVDLDDFKTVNDSLGHAAGDALLIAAAERLRACIRPGDTLARLGGDEFALVLDDPAGDAAVQVAQRIVQGFSIPFPIAGREVIATASVGISVVGPLDVTCPEDILRTADVALYAAKGAGKSRSALFEPAMLTASSERLEFQADLHRALERSQLLLHYQPVVDLSTGTMSGVEALLRWDHPKHGLVEPGRFVPLAEETGLIVPIGRWILHEACRQAARWVAVRTGGAPLSVSLNVSGRQLNDPWFSADVAAALADSGLTPDRLILEITETVFVRPDPAVRAMLDQLRTLGVRIAIDDFGTGYSAFSVLQQIPADIVKIDKTFVDGVRDTSQDTVFVDVIVRLAEAMGLEVIAEGIETAEQAAALSARRCRSGQGYYFGRPSDAAGIDAALHGVLPGRLAVRDVNVTPFQS